MRIIDADALPRYGNRGGLVHWKDIENAPTIDITDTESCHDCQKAINRVLLKGRPKRGAWEASVNGTDEWICSECGHTAETNPYKGVKPNYCPNCGAKMEVEE